jgi:hypothetical protein
VQLNLNQCRISAGGLVDEVQPGRRHLALDNLRGQLSNSEAKQRSSRKRGLPNGLVQEIGGLQSGDIASGDSTRLSGEHPEVERRPGPRASDCQSWHPHACSLPGRREQVRLSLDVSRPAFVPVPAKGSPMGVHLGAGSSHMPMPAEPVIHIRAKPSDGLAAELTLLRESADKRQSGENPAVTSRQSRYVVRGQDLIPGRESLVHPAGKRYVDRRCRRPADRPQPRVFDAHD